MNINYYTLKNKWKYFDFKQIIKSTKYKKQYNKYNNLKYLSNIISI